MQVLAALGDAPTAAIAVVAIVLGVLLAARGPREKRAAGGTGGQEETGPTLLKVPVAAAPEAEPGFVGPEGEVVGHGPIRLGAPGALSGGALEPAAPAPAAPEPAPTLAEPAPPPAASEPPLVESPAPPTPDEPKDSTWRVAARAANSAVHFRQGTIKVGGKPANKPKDE